MKIKLIKWRSMKTNKLLLPILLLAFILMGCEGDVSSETEAKDQTTQQESDHQNTVASSDNSQQTDGSGGATESWGMITYRKTFPPKFNIKKSGVSSPYWRVTFWGWDAQTKFELKEIEVWSEIQILQPIKMHTKSASPSYTMLTYDSPWSDFNDGDYSTAVQLPISKYSPQIIDVEFSTPKQISYFKIFFGISGPKIYYPHKVIIQAYNTSNGQYEDVLEAFYLDDPRVEELWTNQNIRLSLIQGAPCSEGYYRGNFGNCLPIRKACSDLAGEEIYGPLCHIYREADMVDCYPVVTNPPSQDAARAECLSQNADLCTKYQRFKDSSNQPFVLKFHNGEILNSTVCP